jgi:hypothetical protein
VKLDADEIAQIIFFGERWAIHVVLEEDDIGAGGHGGHASLSAGERPLRWLWEAIHSDFISSMVVVAFQSCMWLTEKAIISILSLVEGPRGFRVHNSFYLFLPCG